MCLNPLHSCTIHIYVTGPELSTCTMPTTTLNIWYSVLTATLLFNRELWPKVHCSWFLMRYLWQAQEQSQPQRHRQDRHGHRAIQAQALTHRHRHRHIGTDTDTNNADASSRLPFHKALLQFTQSRPHPCPDQRSCRPSHRADRDFLSQISQCAGKPDRPVTSLKSHTFQLIRNVRSYSFWSAKLFEVLICHCKYKREGKIVLHSDCHAYKSK